MVFNDNFLTSVVFFAIIAWVTGLTIAVLRMIRHYNTLTDGATKASLKEALDHLMQTQKKLEQETKDLYSKVAEEKKDGQFHIQRMGLVRFNPFSDTGGSQSFTLAILDGLDSGFVMTSLYARTGHRWYIKDVAKGKGKTLALSKEEQTAVEKAKPFTNS